MINILPIAILTNAEKAIVLLINSMDSIKVGLQMKKWDDIININSKMIQFATDELAEGNLLNSKSILDSIVRNIEEHSKETPEIYRK